MEEKKEVLRAKFLGIYANVPESLRQDILVIVDGKPYTWNTAYLEVKKDTEIGHKVLKTLKDMEII